MTSRSQHRRRRCAPAATVAGCALALAACSGGTHPAARPASPTTSAAQPQPSATTTTRPPAPARRPVYALTGLPVTEPAKAHRPALSVKIDNISAALPQAGLDRADLVTESLVEGGLTRLMATFQSHDAGAIGPIRSARPVDTDLLRELRGGYFAYSGANRHEIVRVREQSTALLISWDATPGPFWTDPHRAAPHWVFSSTSKLYDWGHRLRPKAAAPEQLFTYSAAAPAGRAVSSAHLRFSSFTTADWRWNRSTHRWLRDQDGRPDALVGGHQIGTTNVVMLQVAVAGTPYHDHAHNPVPWVIVVGHGPCWVLRDGKLVQGTWHRSSAKVAVRIVDRAGKVVALRPGQTWLELIPRPYQPSFG
ncbi:MAG: DUF3048 domain-containing protein [Frankiaceae bacterium]